MSTVTWIAAALGAGALYLWWKGKQAVVPEDTCAQLCRAAGAFCVDGGASCRAIGNVVTSFDGGGAFRTERDRRQKVNDGLNGPAKVTNALPFEVGPNGEIVTAVQSKVLEYANGCVPLYGAPGFASCAPGTLDTYSSAISAASGSLHLTEDNLRTQEAFVSPEAKAAYEDAAGGAYSDVELAQEEHLVKGHAMTGQSADPTTFGPIASDGSGATWWVRGTKRTCPKGQAPRAVVAQGFGDGAVDPTTAGDCMDVFTDPFQVHDLVTCDGAKAPAGYTWNTRTSSWQRLAAGADPSSGNAGPCAGTSTTQPTKQMISLFHTL